MYDSAIGWPARPPLPSDASWEARMARAAAARREIAEAERQVERERAFEALRREVGPVTWLNGWLARDWDTVAIGNGIFCVGCGTCLGCFSIAIDPDRVYTDPGPYPDWPYSEHDCPICAWRKHY
jgi:hypothetical protein